MQTRKSNIHIEAIHSLESTPYKFDFLAKVNILISYHLSVIRILIQLFKTSLTVKIGLHTDLYLSTAADSMHIKSVILFLKRTRTPIKATTPTKH